MLQVSAERFYWNGTSGVQRIKFDGTGLRNLFNPDNYLGNGSISAFAIDNDDLIASYSVQQEMASSGFSQPQYFLGACPMGGTGTCPMQTLIRQSDAAVRQVRAVAIGNGVVYYASSNGSVEQVPRAGGSPTLIASSSSCQELASDDQYIYCNSRQAITRIAIAGGVTPQTLVGQTANVQILSMRVTRERVFWIATQAGSRGLVRSIEKTGANLIDYPNTAPTLNSLAADDRLVYWANTQSEEHPSMVQACTVSACTTPQILATGRYISSMTSDDTSLYWSDFGDGGYAGFRVTKP